MIDVHKRMTFGSKRLATPVSKRGQQDYLFPEVE